MSSDDARGRPDETVLVAFASTVARDLETPLRAARGHLSLLEADPERVAAIDEALADAERILSELRELADGDGLQPSVRVPLGVAAHSAWEGLPTGSARLSVRSNRPIPADPSTFRRLFGTLFEGFLDASDEQGDREPPLDGSPGAVASFALDQATDGVYDGLVVTVGGLADGFYVEADSGEADCDLATVERLAATHGWTVERATTPEGGDRVEFRGVGRRT